MHFRLVRGLASVLLLAGMVLGSIAAIAGESTEKLTGLPLHAGLSFQQTVNSPVCGRKATINLYDVSPEATLAEYVAWHKQQLNGFHYVHKVWSNRAQELFYSPDGSRGIGITGSTNGGGVFAVAFMKFSSTLTTHQEDAFSPANPGCK